jgi:hypothetical protein
MNHRCVQGWQEAVCPGVVSERGQSSFLARQRWEPFDRPANQEEGRPRLRAGQDPQDKRGIAAGAVVERERDIMPRRPPQ